MLFQFSFAFHVWLAKYRQNYPGESRNVSGISPDVVDTLPMSTEHINAIANDLASRPSPEPIASPELTSEQRRLKFQGADPVAKEPEACPAEPASAAEAEPAEEVDVGRGMEDLGLGKYFVYMHVTGYDLH